MQLLDLAQDSFAVMGLVYASYLVNQWPPKRGPNFWSVAALSGPLLATKRFAHRVGKTHNPWIKMLDFILEPTIRGCLDFGADAC